MTRGINRTASLDLNGMNPTKLSSNSSRYGVQGVPLVLAAFSTALSSSEGLYLLEGSVPPGSTGEGAYPLVFREQLPLTMTHSRLNQMVRNRKACSQLITFHLIDKSAPLSHHEDLLFSFLGDVVTAPYAGRDVDRGIALHATCCLAVHKAAPSGKQSFALTLAECYYPEANYPDKDVGACLDKFRLWRLRSRPEQRRSLMVVQVTDSLGGLLR